MRQVHPIVQWLTLALALFVAFTFVILYLRIENVQRHENDGLHSIICYAEHVVLTRPGIPAKQRHESIDFYNHSLADAHLKPCTGG